MTTDEAVRPVIIDRYGDGSMPHALADHLVQAIEQQADLDDRERMIMHFCWNWFAGGDTAASAAAEIEARLNQQ